jgi:methionyl-tRNA formyltransferase
MRLLFFGSPAFAVPALRGLHGAGHRIVRVVTQPDKPRGRSGRPLPTPVKQAALELGLEVFQPAKASDQASMEALRREAAELGVVVAYGEILSAELLSATARGFVNVHASLLPKYRGAAPVNWAIIWGERTTGVSIIRMEPKLDAGPILASSEVAIGEDEMAGELEARLSATGAELLVDLVGRLEAGEQVPGAVQPLRAGFFARKLTKADGRICWTLPAEAIRNRVRGLSPWPGARCEFLKGQRATTVTLLEARAGGEPPERQSGRPGTVIRADSDGVFVQAGTGTVWLRRLKPAGGRAMDAADFVHGHRVQRGDLFR